MKRRTFLKIAGYGLGAGLTLGAAGLAALQPRRRLLPPRSQDDASRPRSAAQRRRVVVVGGGVSGLVSAIELAERNFEVTLVERSPDLGGKLTGWNVKALGEEFPVEHGFHGFFSQYYNLGEVLAASGVADVLSESPGYPVLFGDRPPEVFGQTTSLFPLNLMSVIRQSKSLHLMDFRNDGDGLYDLMRYDGERTFEQHDLTDFERFCVDGKINRPIVETVFLPFGKTTLNRAEKLSAAEAIRFFHFYFMGNPEGLHFKYTKRDSMTAVVRPLRARLEALGGKVRTGVGARRIVREGAAVTQVVVDADPTPLPSLRLADGVVPETGFRALPVEDGSSIYLARRGGAVVAFDGRCTHMGCPVAPDPATGGFRCPCHGGAFDAEGRPTAGPPERPLRTLPVVAAEDGALIIGGGGGSASVGEEALPCDYCVVACEVRGVKRLLSASELREPELSRRVGSLGEADPYVVLRLWLDRPTLPERNPFYTVSRYRYTDSVAIYSKFQEPYIGWARRTGGSVVEVHAYAIAPEAMLPPRALRDAMVEELGHLLPELAGARALHEEFQQQSNFTRWAPGDHALRPSTETPIANLMLAGDHVRLEVPAALMEGAAISGRMAANAILRSEKVREIPISTVAAKGPIA